MQRVFALRGNFAHTPTFHGFEFFEEGYLVCKEGRVAGLFSRLPEQYAKCMVHDYTGCIIIPGMCDIHLHAPQYSFFGIGKNLENADWNDWFEKYAFPDESRYADADFAREAYHRLAGDLLKTVTTRLCVYATIHREATEILMEELAAAGFAAFVGKVNMDRNSMEGLLETTAKSIEETEIWLKETTGKYPNVNPILTPRYLPSCTEECMAALGEIAQSRRLMVQTHLSEGVNEIAWVNELSPGISCYAKAYDRHGLLGGEAPTVLAHCVFPNEAEFSLLQNRNVMVAHCPQSNLSGSGMPAPILRYLEAGIKVGLGTDIAGSYTLNMNKILLDAITASRVWWAFNEQKGDANIKARFLSLANAFYLATKGGGALWGEVGSFEPGYEFDAVVLDDNRHQNGVPRSLYERTERLISLADDRDIVAKYIAGVPVYNKGDNQTIANRWLKI